MSAKENTAIQTDMRVLPTPDGIMATRVHLRALHGYPNHVMLDDSMSDWEVMENHVWEHQNAGRHSSPNHAHWEWD